MRRCVIHIVLSEALTLVRRFSTETTSREWICSASIVRDFRPAFRSSHISVLSRRIFHRGSIMYLKPPAKCPCHYFTVIFRTSKTRWCGFYRASEVRLRGDVVTRQHPQQQQQQQQQQQRPGLPRPRTTPDMVRFRTSQRPSGTPTPPQFRYPPRYYPRTGSSYSQFSTPRYALGRY